ncbi:MAG: hypothetical protein C0418_04780, partial [Coriobacteriaceae bacterium]|nr:hypothetical protein [Coriobacteriaceae bacterium]
MSAVRPLVAVLTEWPEAFEYGRFRHEAAQARVEVEIRRPAQWDTSPFPDVFLSRTGADTTPELLDLFGDIESSSDVRVVNGVDAVRLAGDKLLSSCRLAEAGVPVPALVEAPPGTDPEAVSTAFARAAVVVKPRRGSRGRGVRLVTDPAELRAALSETWAGGSSAVVQEYIASAESVDIRVLVVGDSVLGAMERRAKGGEFRTNVHLGATVREVLLTPELAALARAATHTLGLDIAGVDVVRGKRGPL